MRAWVGAGLAALQDLTVFTIDSYAAFAATGVWYRVNHCPPDASSPFAKFRLKLPATPSPLVDARPQIGVLALPGVSAQCLFGSAFATSPPVNNIAAVIRTGRLGEVVGGFGPPGV